MHSSYRNILDSVINLEARLGKGENMVEILNTGILGFQTNDIFLKICALPPPAVLLFLRKGHRFSTNSFLRTNVQASCAISLSKNRRGKV